jgi:hypothetical protein
MTKKQFRVLYREFLFRIVDRELLSTYARGDMSQLPEFFAQTNNPGQWVGMLALRVPIETN